MMTTSSPITVTIDRLSFGPAGVGRIDGKVVFVPGTVPGDEVVIAVDSQKKKYAIGRVLELRSSSPHRRRPPCPYVSRCGGCPWQHIDYQEQLRAKTLLVEEQLRRIGGLHDIPLLPIIPSPQEWRYRQRIRLHVDPKRRVGFLAPRSHDVVEIDSCAVAWKEVPSHLHIIREWLASLHTVVAQVEVAVEDPLAPPQDQRIVVIAQASDQFHRADAQMCLRLLASHAQVVGVLIQGKGWRRMWGDASRSISGEAEMMTHGGAFTQVNTAANRLLVESVLQLSEVRTSDRVIELYCGSGNFSVSLARRARELIGVEQERNAVAYARANATRAGVTNARFIQATAQGGVRELLKRKMRGDIIVLDPPRVGAADVIEDLPQLGARVVTYVSCNPATLARDLRRLSQHGYRLRGVQPIDMFPQTYHVEIIAVSVLTC